MSGTSSVSGFSSVQELLQRVESQTGQRVMRSASNAAANIPLKALRTAAPVGKGIHKTYKGRYVRPGFLKSTQGLKKKSWRSRDRKAVGATIYLSDEAWYGRLLDTGWRPGKRSKSINKLSKRVKGGLSGSQLKAAGDSRGFVPGNRWIRRTLESTNTQTMHVYKREMILRLRKAIQ